LWGLRQDKCCGKGKHLVHKARLLANRLFSELNVFRAAAFRHLERFSNWPVAQHVEH
jgi:glutaredoxin-related protein